MAIPFTDREMNNAWRENLSTSQNTPRSNAHRLLLFYGVECGLKAVLMRRRRINRTDLCRDIQGCKHNLNKLLSILGAGAALSLPEEIFINKICDTRKNKQERKLNNGQINEMWRYGGKVIAIENNQADDQKIENKLIEISKWIEGELAKL
jgi:hypothetical protein